MLKFIDNFTNKITMYRLVLYYLLSLLIIAVIFGFFKILPYASELLLFSSLILVFSCVVTNEIFSRIYKAPANIESVYITALILALIISPIQIKPFNFYGAMFLFWAGIWAMASKYIFAINKKHIFNPAAFAVALTAITINQPASWWIANLSMTPFVLVGGFILIRKIQRFDLILSFMGFALATIILTTFTRQNIISLFENAIIYSPILFFAFAMLSEPLTTPPTKWLRIAYGAFTGFLFAPAIHIGQIYSTPELALLIGNIFSYTISPKTKLILKLKEVDEIGQSAYDFVFTPSAKLSFKPGQYLEWTLPHKNSDNRGNRRYFTITSSPTEKDLRLGVKFYNKASSFKKALAAMNIGDEIIASQLAGDFTLPKNKDKKLVFIAGGIGITPFRSMVKYLVDNNEKRTITLLYSNKNIDEITYKEIFDRADQELGIKTIYALTKEDQIPNDWQGYRGFINANLIIKEIPDYRERMFYISGPRSMVVSFKEILLSIGVKKNQIKTDFFPGFA